MKMRPWLLLVPILVLAFPVFIPVAAQEATPSSEPEPMTLIGHTGPVNDLAYSPDGSLLASAGADKIVRAWDASTGASVLHVPVTVTAVRVGFISDDIVVAVGGKTVTAWYIHNGDIAGTFDLKGTINDLSVSASGNLFAMATDKGLFVINMAGLDVGDGARQFGDDDQAWKTVAISPDGKIVAAGTMPDFSNDESLDVNSWDLSTGDPLQDYHPVTNDYITDLAFNADGTLLASAGLATAVWNTRSGALQSFSGDQNNGESGVAFAGSFLLSKVFDYQFSSPQVIRDLRSGDRVASLFRQSSKKSLGGGGGYVYQPIAASPDGSHFASADQDGVISIWPLPAARALRASPINIIAYCDLLKDKPQSPAPTDSVNLLWSWYASEPKLIRDHVREVHYRLTLDSQTLDADQAARSLVQRETINNNEWTLYYTLNVGALAKGKHTITYRGTWDHAINDGHDSYGPGTLNADSSGDCTFTVG